jgi:hypothetical protein
MAGEVVKRRLIEKRRRGFFGWIFLLLFWGFNLLMVYSLFVGLNDNAQKYAQLTTDAERTGFAAGTGIGVVLILMIWAFGAVIFGALAYFTRGRRELIEVETRA